VRCMVRNLSAGMASNPVELPAGQFLRSGLLAAVPHTSQQPHDTRIFGWVDRMRAVGVTLWSTQKSWRLLGLRRF
jgi:hypothetical protein